MATLREDGELISQYTTSRDPALREAIILRYVPLVHFVLGRLGLSRAWGQDYEDAASQGLMGLIEAVDRFDSSRSTRFSTYATLYVRGRVLDHLRSLDWLSRTARKRARSIQDAVSALWTKHGRSPSNRELAEYLDIDIAQVQETLVETNRVIVSLDVEMDTDGEAGNPLHEQLADENQPDPANSFYEQELKGRLKEAIQCMSEREQLVLALYYYEELTLKEIGEVLSISESRVCQLHARAILNLRAQMSEASPAAGEKAGTSRAPADHGSPSPFKGQLAATGVDLR